MNMALDEAIALKVLEGTAPPTLRFYEWRRPSITLGAFQKVSEVNLKYCSERAVPVVRRPTGGRAILHGNDLTYSFSSLNSPPFFSESLLKTYSYISQAFLRGFRSMGFDVELKTRREKGRVLTGSALCFQSVSYGEITLKGKKMIGSAQKRWQKGFLQQGSLLLVADAEEMEKVFGTATRDSIISSMIGLLEVYPDTNLKKLKQAILKGFEEVFNVKFQKSSPTEEELKLAERLVKEKYSTIQWLNSRI